MLQQVVNFVQRFAVMLPNYEVACEHEHSNCVLIAHKKVYYSYVRSFGSVLDLCIIQVLCNSQFKVDGRWHTWIDFDKFIELVSL